MTGEAIAIDEIERLLAMTEGANRAERRYAPRWPMVRSLLYKLPGEEKGLSIGYLEDINLIGAKLYLRTEVPLRSKINLSLKVPGHRIPLAVEGEVIWQNPRATRAKKFPAGIRFIRFKPEDKQIVLQHFEELIKESWWRESFSRDNSEFEGGK